MPIPKPTATQTENEYISECIAFLVGEGKDKEQAAAICYNTWKENHAKEKISFDYDETLTTAKGSDLARKFIEQGIDVYIISARHDKESILEKARSLTIPESRVYATGSNKEKIKKIKELGITKHYDNNSDVIKALGTIGEKFSIPTITIK
jgi:Asp/Glu/hydantoin racemase